MKYQVIIKRQVKKQLQKLSRPVRTRIAEKIELLGYDFNSSLLDIKKMKGQPYYRLRIGEWRVIFDKDDQLKIIAIEKLNSRGGVYK